MLKPLLIGLVAGMRSMTALAAASTARSRALRSGEHAILDSLAAPPMVRTSIALAAGELVGDKLPSAPDRIIAAGMVARVLSGALAGAAFAAQDRREAGALVGASAAVAGAYLSFILRARAIERFGQQPSGIVEDILAVGLAIWLLKQQSDRA